MKIIKNEKRIKRYSQVGVLASLAAFIILAGGMYITFTNLSDPKMGTYSLIAFVVGFILIQIGSYLMNKYGGVPRPDEKLDAGLKGLPGDYTIYHSATPALHLLVGPAGIWALLIYRQRGVAVTYKKNRWRISGGGILQAYLRIFGQEGIGRPDLEAEGEIKAVRKLLAKNLGEGEIPDVQAALIFMNDEVDLQVEGAPLPAMKLKQLKEFIRKKAKEKPLGQTQLAAIKSALPE